MSKERPRQKEYNNKCKVRYYAIMGKECQMVSKDG